MGLRHALQLSWSIRMGLLMTTTALSSGIALRQRDHVRSDQLGGPFGRLFGPQSGRLCRDDRLPPVIHSLVDCQFICFMLGRYEPDSLTCIAHNYSNSLSDLVLRNGSLGSSESTFIPSHSRSLSHHEFAWVGGEAVDRFNMHIRIDISVLNRCSLFTQSTFRITKGSTRRNRSSYCFYSWLLNHFLRKFLFSFKALTLDSCNKPLLSKTNGAQFCWRR